jgi:hypothetical protein
MYRFMVEDLDIVGVDVGEVSGSELVASLLENMPNGKRIFTPLGDMLSSTCGSVTFKTDVAMEFEDKIIHWRDVRATIRRFEDWCDKV